MGDPLEEVVEDGEALPDGGGGAAEDHALGDLLDKKGDTGQDYITQKHKKLKKKKCIDPLYIGLV